MANAPAQKKSMNQPAIVKGIDISEIFSENVAAKILQVAQRGMKNPAPLKTYPHTVPQTGPNAGTYEEREADFWTCGFFPGSIYALLERATRYPQALRIPTSLRPQLSAQLLALGRHWSVAIAHMSRRTDTHDMGFIVQPALQSDWELTGNAASLACVVDAAYALSSRWDERVGAIRSWDVAVNNRYALTDMGRNFLVIVDSMCNLDLLYYVAHHVGDPALAALATRHADTVMQAIIRPDHSTFHLVNFDPATGRPQAKLTNQGWDDDSTWSRGQAWCILGFAQVYAWTKDGKYLATAVDCAQYFLRRAREGEGKWTYPLVPRWDFDAPREEGGVLRDVSAGLIAANGLLLVHRALQALPSESAAQIVGESDMDFLDTAVRIVGQTLEMAYDSDLASFATAPLGKDVVNGNRSPDEQVSVRESGFDAILRHSTANWNADAHVKYKDHGLVYADYYLLEFGNKMLRMGVL
ncbi:glycoside hydrolase family 88 protein [Dothidotthia symphoricarpi CBS 119687]|uniref:Glycoside hydrolase family 88 protein n=1 Tax=Dothidotthia symphoricarpi CBS 119687 TaxID=1392245 RepID=A0A6A6AI68_9PLEO|nr:glycoside hydrolase family 88 protein [Dothidotthia symphoricarpi CBS 119687]KAF2130607.1 glycoside hydrolase family 88 protein [Dothidotthia symphoricarpi CBS 119687]